MNQILDNDLNKELKENITEDNIEKKQNNFLGNILGKTINTAIDTGLRIILPNSIEDSVIDIKNSLEKIKCDLSTDETILFDGEPMCKEAIESLLTAMEVGLSLVKQKQKRDNNI